MTTDRRSQDAVDRALSDLIVTIALRGDAGDEIETIANTLHIWRDYQREAKPAKPARKPKGGGDGDKSAAEQPPAEAMMETRTC